MSNPNPAPHLSLVVNDQRVLGQMFTQRKISAAYKQLAENISQRAANMHDFFYHANMRGVHCKFRVLTLFVWLQAHLFLGSLSQGML